MRNPARLFRPAVAAAAVAVLLTACGGSGDEEPAASSSSSSSSSASATSSSAAPTTSSDPAVAAFCERGQEFDQVAESLATAAPPELPGILQQAVAAFDTVQPPAEIAADWQTLGTALRQLADASATLDLGTPEGQQQLQQAATLAFASAGTAQANVQAFTSANCATPSAAPTT
jgi:hypothetical protein